MKLKKTLSMLIGGICLVAATTVALAGPVCYRCDEVTHPVYVSRFVKKEVFVYYNVQSGKRFSCEHNVYKSGTKYICTCGNDIGWASQPREYRKDHSNPSLCPMR